MDGQYHPPLALTVLSGIFLGLGAVCLLIVTVDIILRRGWRSMMAIMIPVYIINASYMLPVTLYVYFKYGRPSKPTSPHKDPIEDTPKTAASCHAVHQPAKEEEAGCHIPDTSRHPSDSDVEKARSAEDPVETQPQPVGHSCHSSSASRPLWATLLVGVSHCGAGCVLGDLVGEWLVYGTGATINGHSIWVELPVDYAFALLFGIAFQYFSIAPMSGEYGVKSVWRAAKADILSLTSFEVGAFGWMVIYQVGIFGYRLGVTTWTYWWMMQIGMAFGFATAIPMNYYLITRGIKEPCA